MQQHKIVSREEWITARKALMIGEKELTQAREALSRQRRELPWVKVDKDYVFDGPGGKMTLGDLFKGRPQLVVQHVMFAPEWDAACKSCSFWADGFERMVPHLAARDTTMIAVSRAPLAKLDAFKARMGWTFDWVSSGGERLQLRLRRLVHASADRCGDREVQLWNDPALRSRTARHQRVLSRRAGKRVPHLLDLRARPRHDECRLSLSRPDAARPPRGRIALSDGLGAAT
ncbi:putative dithiol-disulfide oxidoreductase (DUF899 family) [Bradyrhizobium elkanii]